MSERILFIVNWAETFNSVYKSSDDFELITNAILNLTRFKNKYAKHSFLEPCLNTRLDTATLQRLRFTYLSPASEQFSYRCWKIFQNLTTRGTFLSESWFLSLFKSVSTFSNVHFFDRTISSNITRRAFVGSRQPPFRNRQLRLAQ